MADTMVALRPAVPSVRHHIAPEWDLIIVVDELAPRGTGSAQDRVICTHEFEVSKDALSKIPYFNVAASSKSFADTGKNDFEVKGGDDPAAFDICLRLVHGCLDKTNPEARISTIWNVLVTSRKYGFDALSDELKQWFSAWYATRKENFNTMDCRELLYPCYHFDHAQAFAAVTKRLAYKEVGHIEEHMPELVDAEQKEHRIGNNRVIGSLNGARGSLKTKLHSNLYEPSRVLLSPTRARCQFKEKVFWSYHRALEDTGAWPIEIQGMRKSIDGLLTLLEKFKFKDPHVDAACSDPGYCLQNFKVGVQSAIMAAREQFDGLCLDCMNISGSTKRDEDQEYWDHSARRQWDAGCRIDHGQPTWYFSFLGRREKMALFQKGQRQKS